jgi:hypothetical protein
MIDRRRKLMIAACAFLIVLFALVSFWPQRVIPDAAQYEIQKVTYYENGQGTEITAQVDLEQLKALLADAKCSRMPNSRGSYSLDEIVFEIDGVCADAPLHIVLGSFYEVYESADEGSFNIWNGAELLSQVSALAGIQ